MQQLPPAVWRKGKAVKDFKKDMIDAELTKKDVQGHCKAIMNDSAEKRAEETKSMTDKRCVGTGEDDWVVVASSVRCEQRRHHDSMIFFELRTKQAKLFAELEQWSGSHPQARMSAGAECTGTGSNAT